MRMNIKLIFLLGVVLCSSCKKWLEMPSEKEFDSETIFDNVSRAEMAVLGAYSSTFNRELYYQFGMGTDECFSTEGETNSKNQVANYVYNTSNIPTSTYTAMYAGVEYANVCIKNLPQMEAANEQEKRKLDMLLGESYAIRAMNMLNVVRFFGDVPYPKIPVVDVGTFNSSRVSRDTILDGCIEDLQKAIELLPWKGEGMVATSERFTKNTAYGVLARVALYAAGYSLRWDLNSFAPGSVSIAQRNDANRITQLYEIARDACKAIVDRGENNLIAYETVFRDLVNGQYNVETMLEYGQHGANSNDGSIGYTNGMFAHTNCMFGKAQPAMGALPTYYFDFSEGDLRRDVAICNYSIASDNTRQMNNYAGMTIGKFRVTWKAEIGTAINKRDINWPVLRYSDVLLMYAEAENELNHGPTALAVEMYEKVRSRAFNNDRAKMGSTPSSYEDFRKAIISERKLELGFEGWRRTDLTRWGILYETLSETKQKLIQLAKGEGPYAGVDKYRAYKKEQAKSFLDPVVAVPFIGYSQAPTASEQQELNAQGYTLLEMHGNVSLFNANRTDASSAWITGLFRGLEKNKVEILPLNATTIDDNPGLQGQQHPLY
ncbi:RagB/SusD family nutrient uptake outer membrane protein [Olivibacter sp. CPCC 100613]|uniref:RagB/SusD family nutrient uptake outer membrane protein n=1 Tax=Olivibacter sp. CPCC 100613 TaxID=3079931 RepID=UPI002FF4A9FD